MPLCEVCNEPGKFKCTKCGQAFYCSAEHQRQSWKEHKKVCGSVSAAKPQKDVSETVGRSSGAAGNSPASGQLPAGSNLTAVEQLTGTASSEVNLDRGICRFINLDRRRDRKTAFERLVEPHQWLTSNLKRIPAVDGKTLEWQSLASSRMFTPQACMEGQMAQQMKQATMNEQSPEEGSSHLTLGGCGCALSHLKAWKELRSSGADWALIMEDDIVNLSTTFEAELVTVLGAMPSTWQVCYLAHHTPHAGSSSPLLLPGKHVESPCRIAEDTDSWLPGLFCYLISKEGANTMIEKVVPFVAQVDFGFGSAAFESGQCYALLPGSFLAYSPPTEVSRDTDIQTF